MELMIMYSELLKILTVSFLIYFAYVRITNYKNNDKYKRFFIIICSINISLLYITLKQYFHPLIVIIILYFIYGLIVKKIIERDELDYSIVGYIFSCAIAYVLYLISILISGILLLIILNKGKYTDPISLITIPTISTLLFIFVFSRKRFKNGFNFLKNEKVNKNIRDFSIIFVGIVIIIFSFLLKMDDLVFQRGVLIGSIFVIIGISIWIKSQITKIYKSRMRDRTIEMQKAEIDEKARIMEELKAENIKLGAAVHKYNKKFSALEFAMKNALEIGVNTEFANELSVILKETKDASKNFAKEVEIKNNKLPLTNNVGIDNMFKYMREEARKKDINFDFKLNTSINPLLENAISKDKFETLIGDHLKDAIIAVNASENSYKSILVTLGIIDGIYEFSIYDTGIEFEIETLLKLGQEQVTTHKEEGGSGIGFMTTFETLKECKASLIIEEYNPETTNYTKAVIIRFDGKNKYKICSYRAEKIKEQKHKRRIIIEKLK